MSGTTPAGSAKSAQPDKSTRSGGGGSLSALRLEVADTRSFSAPGVGRIRRERIAGLIDGWLCDIWAAATQDRPTPGLALVSVGSLARRECGPLSDLDLVLLHDTRVLSPVELNELAERIWYPIWDAKIKLDHSVRTVAQCRDVAKSDLSAVAGLLDARHIAGDVELVNAARATVAHDWRGTARSRLPALVETVTARHDRHGELAHLIEPDLKESRGGLRDMTIVRALTDAWLADRPHGAVDTAYQRLLDVRDAIHVVTGRGRDRLMLADQDGVAALLGYNDPDDLLTDISADAREVSFALESTMRRASQSQRARTLRVGPRRPTLTPLGYGVHLHDGEVVLGPRSDPSADPLLVLRAATVAARNNLPLAPATLHNLATRSAPMQTPWPVHARLLLADLLSAGPGLVNVWEGLDLAGVISSWIPEWSAVRSRPQRNAVHRHTVDRHLVETVVAASTLVRRVSRPDLLLVAALLHDIGKVAGAHDHSVEGARIVRPIVERLGLSGADADTVVLLVREHLTLMDLATRRDPTDPRTIERVVSTVGGSHHTLELLEVLTEADAIAAGPLAWTDWRQRLLARLLARVRASGQLDLAVTPPRPDADFALTAAMSQALAAAEPWVGLSSHGTVHELTIVDRDRLGLFADTAGLLAGLGFVVRSALVRTVDGVAANEWHVEAPSGAVPEPARIARDLARLASGDRGPLGGVQRRRQVRPSSPSGRPLAPSRALVLSDASDTATVIEVRAGDRPGLVHDIGLTLARSGLNVRSAHVATYAGQALDTFYITEFGGRPLTPARVAATVASIIDTCDHLG